jgi:hypothetical protein
MSLSDGEVQINKTEKGPFPNDEYCPMGEIDIS